MVKVGKRSTFLPVSGGQYFTYQNHSEWVIPIPHFPPGGSYSNIIISRSDSQPLSKEVCWSDGIITEEFFDVPTNYSNTGNHSYIDFSQSRTPFFLRTDGMKYIDEILLIPFEADCNVSIVKQEKIILPVFVKIEDVFNELYIQWREHTKFNSFIGNSSDSYYEKIIQLGDTVIPFIIEKLRKEHSHLFIALSRITGENPVKKENMGNVRKMAENWIQWWDEKAYDTSRLY